MIFCNESSYDHHFTMRELEKEFGGEFYCLEKALKSKYLSQFQQHKKLKGLIKIKNNLP